MALSKNPGPLLTSIIKGAIEAVPQRWRTKLGFTKTSQKQPLDITPSVATTHVGSAVNQDLTDERNKVDYVIGTPTGVTMIEYIRTQEGQVATREVKYVPEGTAAPSFNELLQEFRQDADGTGYAEQIKVTVGSLFTNHMCGRSIENLIPPKFRAHIPTKTDEVDSAGTVVCGALSTGEFEHVETQKTVDIKRTRTVTIDAPSVPVTFTDEELTEEYGGGILDVIYTLHTEGMLTIDEGLLVVSSELVNLGNGYEIKTTKQVQGSEWPELEGTETDPRTGIAVDVKKQVVAAGTLGGVAMDGSYVDAKTIDKWRTLLISSKLDPTTLPDPKVWETTIEHRFDNTLLEIGWIWAAASGVLAYDFDMVPIMNIKQGYAGPCRAKITESFSDGPPSDVVTPTIFCPQSHVIGFVWAFAADTSGDCDACTDIARAHAQAWQVPVTLHDEIDLSGTVTITGGEFTDTLPATVPVGLPTPGTLIVKACDVEEWRFNVFYRRLVEIYVPDCEPA